MKIYLSLLKKFIDLPIEDINELRDVFNDLGLEVEDIIEENKETCFNLETLAHRGDHLYALGIAREFSARYLIPVKPLEVVSSWNTCDLPLEVDVQTKLCFRYALLETTLPKEKKLPKEITKYLPEDLPFAVAILNYVSLELGQPMHAFDKDKIEGNIKVVLSDKEEEVETIGGKIIKVPPESILIKDSKKTIAVAGVIGCVNSMVTEQTKEILIESATFDQVSIRKTARKMGISTDASYAFERGCDPEATLLALKRVVALLEKFSGRASKYPLFYVQKKESNPPTFNFTLDRLCKFLSLPDLRAKEIEERLEFLGYTVEFNKQNKEFKVTPPSWRFWNIQTVEAVIEDFVRVYGLNRLPLTLPPLSYEMPALFVNETLLQKMEKALLGNGFFEVVTKSYYSQEMVNYISELDPLAKAKHILLKNALESSIMKTTNIIHMAKLADYNFKKGMKVFKAYEFGRVFSQHPMVGQYQYEQDVLTLAASGRWYDYEWKKPESREEIFFLFKGVLSSICQALGGQLEITESNVPLLHPMCQANVFINGMQVGFFGLAHPQLLSRLDIKDNLFYAELNVFLLSKLASKKERDSMIDYPSIKRDFTFKLEKESFAGDVIKQILSLNIKDLQRISIVDSYEKEGENFRRVTYRLLFQNSERTLMNEEIDKSVTEFLQTMDAQFNLQLIS